MSLMVACAEAVFERQRGAARGAVDPGVPARRAHRATARAPSSSTTCSPAINLAGAAEALALAERARARPARTLDVIERSSGQSWIGADRMRRAMAGDYAPRAHTALLRQGHAARARDGGRGRAGAAARHRRGGALRRGLRRRPCAARRRQPVRARARTRAGAESIRQSLRM